MNPFEIAVRASIVVAVALTASAVLRRRSASLRHWVLAAGILSAATVAPLTLALPAWDLPSPLPAADAPLTATLDAPAQSSDAGAVANQPVTPPARPTASVEQVAGVVWAAGFAVGAILMLVRLLRLARLTRRARSVTDHRIVGLAQELSVRLGVRPPVRVLQTRSPDILGTWGWRRPIVLFPAHYEIWSDARIRIVLGHELAHIRRADWAIQIAADLVRAAFWYNPLFWLACARLRRESEQACDDAVLDAGVPAPEYAMHLLAIARMCRPASPLGILVPMARRSTLEWRIAAMLNTTLARTRPTRRALTLALAVIVGITLTTASFRAKEQAGPMPLTGTVYDVTGSVLPGVALTLDDRAGNRVAQSTDRDGHFNFGTVAPGRYLLGSNLPGFLAFTQEMTLEHERQWERSLTLQVGTLQENITVRDQRPPGAPIRGERVPVRIGGNIRAPRKLVDVRPIYPQTMREAGLEGTVSLGALIGVDGSVSSVRVTGSPAHPELAKAAAEAVRQWQFSPTLLNGEAVEVFMNVLVAFSLQD